jgi:hypothetical protein
MNVPAAVEQVKVCLTGNRVLYAVVKVFYEVPGRKSPAHWLATLERAAEVLPNIHWVCCALDNGVEPEIEKEVIAAISEAIAPFSTVRSWLFREVGKDLVTREVAREYRKAWLNHMIEQCRTA